jgi:hypothetical protein
MVYLKSILAGTTAFLVAIIAWSVMTVAIMWPNPSNWQSLGWGSFMAFDVPGWHGWIMGVLAFTAAFLWKFRKASIHHRDAETS